MHLFAGIGGGLLADLILGHKPIVAVEWEPYACRVLRERAAEGWFPGLHVWEGDVRLFDPSEYTGKVDCIHAGFPCQDISVAGKQAGVSEGTRSGLYREVLRIADAIRPKSIFLENVAAITSNGLGTVLGDLAAMGYDARWCCIRASDVGAPHHRDRWFLLAYSISDGAYGWRKCKVRNSSPNESTQAKWGDDVFPLEGCRESLAYSNDKRCKEFNAPGISEIPGWNGGSVDAGWGSSWWTTEPELGRVANGIPNRVGQLKGYGNAQVPLQAAAAFKFLHGE